MAYEPELLLTGHTGALEVTRADLDEFMAWAQGARARRRAACRRFPGLADEALDPYPGLVRPIPRRRWPPAHLVATTVMVRNHGPEPREARIRASGCPRAGRAEPAEAITTVVPAGGGTVVHRRDA